MRALSGAALWRLGAQSQQSSNVPLVAVLSPASLEFTKPRIDALRKGLLEAGLIEGAHYAMAMRPATLVSHPAPWTTR